MKNIPTNLRHIPIVYIDYEDIDVYGGAKFLSLGRATWNKDDCSAKIWRESAEHWSRQSEELPLARLLDLSILLISMIKSNNNKSYFKEKNIKISKTEDVEFLMDYLNDNMQLYLPKIEQIKDLLYTENNISIENQHAPNLFDFATTELSQDALFAWILQYADSSNSTLDYNLHLLGQNFLKLLIGKDDIKIDTVKVGKQWANIDIWVEINDDIFLAIEDKTRSSIHDNQLQRYKDIVSEEYNGKRNNLYYAYTKITNEPLNVINKIKDIGYNVILREDLLKLFAQYKGTNPIILDYLKYLKRIEANNQKFKILPVNEWDWYSWQGFYKELDQIINFTSWGYVSNPAGGFLGAWWHFTDINEEVDMYLQFEESKLCFKIAYEGDENRTEIRCKYHNLLMKVKGDNYPEIVKPERFGAGVYMTIAIVNSEYLFGTGIINIDDIKEKIAKYEFIIDLCSKTDNAEIES